MQKVKELKEGLLSKETAPISEFLSSGCTLIDLNMGGGAGMGYKRGVFHRVSGVKGAGKTFLLSEVGAIAKRKYKEKAIVAIQDCEERNTMDTLELYGVERNDLISDTPPKTVEELDADLGLFLKSVKKGQVAIYGVDSMESLTNADIEGRAEERMDKYEAGKEVVDKGTMGMQSAKFFSQEFFRTKKNSLADTEATCFLLSQMRENVDKKNPYAPKYKTTGGPTIEHWVDSAAELKVVKQLGAKERPIGAVVELKTTKLTAPRPYRSCRYNVYYTYGIDNIGSNIDYLFELRGLDGELLAKAENIPWSGKPITLKLLKEWLVKTEDLTGLELEVEAKRAFKAVEGKAVLNLDWHQEYFRNHENQTIAEMFIGAFGSDEGVTYTREALIKAVEDDSAMEKELERRVIEKWEQLETEATAELSGRKRRY